MTERSNDDWGPSLLGIYLNDHLAGATAGVDLARRAAAAQRGRAAARTLTGLAGDIAEDREALLEVMDALSVPVRHYKVYGAWVAEKLGRFKPNGRIVTRSPLSDLVELEALRLAVEGKAAGWRTLRALAGSDTRLDARRLDDLLGRARRQAETLEELRLATAAEVLTVDDRRTRAHHERG